MSGLFVGRSRLARALGCALIGCVLAIAGCATRSADSGLGQGSSRQEIQQPPGATQADVDRGMLGLLVGTWSFEGWRTAHDGARSDVRGRAAGVIEKEHFVLLDLIASPDPPGGAVSRSGSMLFASEPEVGLTLTTWGNASPSMNRFTGRAEDGGAVVAFDEMPTPAGRRRFAFRIIFETDDRWVGEIRDESAPGDPIIAKYTFSRTTG